MTAAENVMRRIVELFSRGDLSDVTSLVSEDYIDHQGLVGIEIRGQDGFRQIVAAARGAFECLEVRIEDIVSEGDKVVARLRWEGRQADGSSDVRETIDFLHLRDGLIEHWGAAVSDE
jgi:ketosteroid isomerase-like protein